jgi:hypothetical protein
MALPRAWRQQNNDMTPTVERGEFQRPEAAGGNSAFAQSARGASAAWPRAGGGGRDQAGHKKFSRRGTFRSTLPTKV